MPLWIKAILLGIIQGLTEFLPVSSTGHMIIVDEYIHLPSGFREMFLVVVQLGSILSVVVYFRSKLFPKELFTGKMPFSEIWRLWWRVALGVLPALVLGGLFGSLLKEKLYCTMTVAVALLLGGIAMLFLERIPHKAGVSRIEGLSVRRILGIGLAQAVAMIPGVSRSAATIIGGVCLGCTREVAVEYSFYLAIPTMLAASAYSMLKEGTALTSSEWGAVAAGSITAFLVAWGVIAVFMSYIRRRDFSLFGWYRIVLALVLLAWQFLR